MFVYLDRYWLLDRCHWSLEANLACGTVAIKIEVLAVATIWSSAHQRIGDRVCATRLTIPNS
jgi:hypothetical protein